MRPPDSTFTFVLTASIPAPPGNSLDIGPLTFHLYGLMIMLGVLAAVRLGERRWVARGGTPGDMTAIALWAVPGGLIGARIYHVVTDSQLFYGRWLHVFAIWEGGLGIPGGVIGGVAAGMWVARKKGLPVGRLLDVAAPCLPLAQAIGRIGNWFNQELFGRPTGLPWGLKVDPQYRPARYETFTTFHPTFAYEALWNLGLIGVLFFVERRFKLKTGRLFAVYVGGYALGRLWVEGLRIDPANKIAGLRVNEWTSLVAILGALLVLWLSRSKGEGGPVDPVDPTDPVDVADASEEEAEESVGQESFSSGRSIEPEAPSVPPDR